MAKGSSGNTVYLVGLICSILVSLALLGVAYKLNEDLTAMRQAKEDAEQRFQAENERVKTLNQEIKDIRQLVTGDPNREVRYDHFFDTVFATSEKKLEEILSAEWSDDYKNYDDQVLRKAWEALEQHRQKHERPDYTNNFADLFHEMYDQLTAVIYLIPRMRYERVRALQNVDSIRQQKEEQRAKLEEDIEKLRREKNRLQDTIIEKERTFDEAKRRLREEKENIQKERSRLERDFRLEEARLQSKVSERDARIDQLTQKKRKSFGEYSQPDGEVVYAESGWAWIDLGRRHGLRRNTRFQVYQFVKGGRQKIKGAVEVRSIDDGMAQCAILQDHEIEHPITREMVMTPDPDDPIVKGDQVRTPLFDPHEQKVFVFLGDSPQNRFYSPDELEQKLEEFGARVDREVTIETDYVILLGGAEEDADLQDQIKRASQYGVIFMVEKALLEYLGH